MMSVLMSVSGLILGFFANHKVPVSNHTRQPIIGNHLYVKNQGCFIVLSNS